MSVLTLKGLGSNLGQAEAFQELVEVFLASYFSRMDRAIAERVPVNAALIFLKRACKRFRWQNEPNWQDSIRLQVQSGVECLALQESHRPPRDLPSLIELCGSCPPAT